MHMIRKRLEILVNLPEAGLHHLQLEQTARDLGKS
jgi:hypothetical protein